MASPVPVGWPYGLRPWWLEKPSLLIKKAPPCKAFYVAVANIVGLLIIIKSLIDKILLMTESKPSS
jgi:hypothetical protein